MSLCNYNKTDEEIDAQFRKGKIFKPDSGRFVENNVKNIKLINNILERNKCVYRLNGVSGQRESVSTNATSSSKSPIIRKTSKKITKKHSPAEVSREPEEVSYEPEVPQETVYEVPHVKTYKTLEFLNETFPEEVIKEIFENATPQVIINATMKQARHFDKNIQNLLDTDLKILQSNLGPEDTLDFENNYEEPDLEDIEEEPIVAKKQYPVQQQRKDFREKKHLSKDVKERVRDEIDIQNIVKRYVDKKQELDTINSELIKAIREKDDDSKLLLSDMKNDLKKEVAEISALLMKHGKNPSDFAFGKNSSEFAMRKTGLKSNRKRKVTLKIKNKVLRKRSKKTKKAKGTVSKKIISKKLAFGSGSRNFGSGSGIYGLQNGPTYSGLYPLSSNLITTSYKGDGIPMHYGRDIPNLNNVVRDYRNFDPLVRPQGPGGSMYGLPKKDKKDKKELVCRNKCNCTCNFGSNSFGSTNNSFGSTNNEFGCQSCSCSNQNQASRFGQSKFGDSGCSSKEDKSAMSAEVDSENRFGEGDEDEDEDLDVEFGSKKKSNYNDEDSEDEDSEDEEDDDDEEFGSKKSRGFGSEIESGQEPATEAPMSLDSGIDAGSMENTGLVGPI
jgi:hypothetical protein